MQVSQTSNFTYLFWEYGYPTPYTSRRPQSDANQTARDNPDLIIQTGYYSLRLGCDDMLLTGYDAVSSPTDYLTALSQDVVNFTSVKAFDIHIYVGGTAYLCQGGVVGELVNNSHHQYVRLIEGGQYMQRFDCTKLIFRSGEDQLDTTGVRLEITAWPDRVALLLDCSQATIAAQVERITILLRAPNQSDEQQLWTSAYENRAELAFKPHLDLQLFEESWVPSSYVTEATRVDTSEALTVTFDPDVYGFRIEVTSDPINWPENLERVDEYVIQVTNPSPTAAENVPLVFNAVRGGATNTTITGTMMVLHDENDYMRPSGIAVQVSKNWHIDYDNPTVHEGHWLRGSTLVALQPGETKRFRLRVVYGNWTGAAAASYSQLSLIGYGGNWTWDESALGAWGESITFDPTQHLGWAMMCDIRPSFTTAMKGGAYNWTENVGGGEMIVYQDSNNTFRWPTKIKTAYYWVGPNLTEVLYSGVTDDQKIRFTYTMRMGRTNDYHRRSLRFKYEFVQAVTSPQRLLFFQMVADWYMVPNFTNYYIGAATGTPERRVADPGGNIYKGVPFDFTSKFVAIDDTQAGGEEPKANRGLIHRGSTLNGQPFNVFLHPYGRTWGSDTMLFDLSSDDVQRSYQAGDVVEGEVGFVLTPKNADVYWGSDEELRGRLQTYTTPWQAVQAEMNHNNLTVTMHTGTLLKNYPVEIAAAPVEDSGISADFTIEGGGIGHVPIILRGVQQGYGVGMQRYSGGDPEWVWLEDVNIQGHNYYQGYNKPEGTRDYAFNITRPPGDATLTNPWRLRVSQGRDFP